MHRRQCKLVSSSGLFFGHVLYCVVLLTHNACRVCERGMVGQRLWPGSLRVSWRVQALETCWDSRSSCVYFKCTLNVLHLLYVLLSSWNMKFRSLLDIKTWAFSECALVAQAVSHGWSWLGHWEVLSSACSACCALSCCFFSFLVLTVVTLEFQVLPAACLGGEQWGLGKQGWAGGWAEILEGIQGIRSFKIFWTKFFIVFHIDLFRISESCHICSDLDCWCTMLCTACWVFVAGTETDRGSTLGQEGASCGTSRWKNIVRNTMEIQNI